MATSFSYSVYESPVGLIYIASGANGVTGLSIGACEADFVRDMASSRGVAPSFDNGRLPELFSELDEYFLGRPTSFSVQLDPSGSSFDTLVWKALLAIPWGCCLSYGELAEAIGTPGAARAVGSSCARNPIPIIIPCHRVLLSGGSIGGYSGGEGVKEKLLTLEGIPFKGR